MPTLTEQEIETLRRWSRDPILFTPSLVSHCELLARAADTIVELKKHNELLGKAFDEYKDSLHDAG